MHWIFFIVFHNEEYIHVWQLVETLDLARATMAKVHQNLSWAVAYNVVAIPIAAGLLLPQFDFAMTPSLSGDRISFPIYTDILTIFINSIKDAQLLTLCLITQKGCG